MSKGKKTIQYTVESNNLPVYNNNIPAYSNNLPVCSSNLPVYNGYYSSTYTGASGKNSLVEWSPSRGDANTVDLVSLETLRSRSRDLIRNAPGATGAIKTLLTGVIGQGLKLQPSIDREYLGFNEEQASAFEGKVKQEFRLWSENRECDFYRQLTFNGLQKLAFNSWLSSGDVFVLLPYKNTGNMPYNLKVQLIEADRVCNPNDLGDTADIAGGIEYDANGVRTAIYIRTPHPGSTLYKQGSMRPTWQRVAFYGERSGRQNVLHLIDVTRIGQSRGIPILAPVIDTLKQVSKYAEAELTAAVVNALLAVAIKRNPPDSLSATYSWSGGSSETDKDGNTVNPPWSREDNFKLGTGSWIDLAPYEDLQVINAERPSNQYDIFFMSCMKQIGMAIGVPFEVLVKQFNSSYSASRAAMLDALRYYTGIRDIFIDEFCQPIYNEWMTEGVFLNRIPANSFLVDPIKRLAYSGAYWIAPTVGSIDEGKDIDSADKRIKAMLSSPQIEASKNGNDFKDIVAQHVEANNILIANGLPPINYNVADGREGDKAIRQEGEKEAS